MNEYFLPSATMKLTLWKDNQQNEAKVFGASFSRANWPEFHINIYLCVQR